MEQRSGDAKSLSPGHSLKALTDKQIKIKLKSQKCDLTYKVLEKSDIESDIELKQSFCSKNSRETLHRNENTNDKSDENKAIKVNQIVYEIQEIIPKFKKNAGIVDEETKAEIEKGPKSDNWRYYELISNPFPQYTSKKANSDNDSNLLKFDSIFESGNLQKAIRVDEREYVLIIRPDTRAANYKHWFYFLCKNQNPITVRFHIINFVKFDKLLADGMQPVILSTKSLLEKGKTWRRKGWDISFQNTVNFKEFLSQESSDCEYFTYSFTYHFSYEKDTVKFAYSFPYTYTDLSNFLSEIKKKNTKIARVEKLAETIGGNSCEMITITNKVASYDINKKKKKENEHSGKKGVFITARVHPGESPSSYIMQGLVKFLLGNSKDAKLLRKEFIFCIIPMLNPDGVIHGNTRCSLLGVDLNRRWIKPNKILHPTIYYAKELIVKMKEANDVALYCDLHAHAKKKNVFMYGCCTTPKCDKTKKLTAMLTPVFMAKANSKFSYKNTHYRLEKQKESTARIVLFKQLGIINSYTMECSFFGPEGPNNPYFTLADFSKIGKDLAKSCLIFVNTSTLNRNLHLTTEWINDYKESCKKDKRSDETPIHSKDLALAGISYNAIQEELYFVQENYKEHEITIQEPENEIKQIDDDIFYSETDRYIHTAELADETGECKKSETLVNSMHTDRRTSQVFHTKFISFTPNLIACSKVQNHKKSYQSKRASLVSLSRKPTMPADPYLSQTNVQKIVTPLKGKKIGFDLCPIVELKTKHPIPNGNCKDDKKSCVLHKGLQCSNPIFSKNYLEYLKKHKRNNSDNGNVSIKDLNKFLVASKLQ
ncbi:unnamed protein product [Blepharisma stoltei]|uniref:Peptidase M14 domain-containing protein n=1 Tax=Blepharisma stoltei TaxID=1481888 RepID=A0AAU9JS50_9CILI|nr:unnamed protein product [Blepharisma stoltei]